MQISMRRLMLFLTVACIVLGVAVSYVVPNWSHYWFYRGVGFQPPEWAEIKDSYSISSHAIGSLVGGAWAFRHFYLTMFPLAIGLVLVGQKTRRVRA